MRAPWRNAATVICAAPKLGTGSNSSGGGGSAVSILMVKRHADSRVMPGVCSFPGGALDEADFDGRWSEEYFHHTKQEHRSQWVEIIKNVEHSPCRIPAFQMYRKNRRTIPESDQAFHTPAEWAFKIAALRELFEECGLLICFNKEKKMIEYLSTAEKNGDKLLEVDRKVVHSDAKQFFEVCSRRSVLPAFWLLREWANWLTPTVFPTNTRFDSVFYMLCLNLTVHVLPDPHELEKAEWVLPRQAFIDGIKGCLTLAPPQIYELSRLSNFKQIDDLDRFAADREKFGLVRYCPNLIKCSDGLAISCLQGDDLFDEHADLTRGSQPAVELNETSEQMLKKAKNLHRLVFKPPRWIQGKYYCNIKQPCGHVGPISDILSLD